MSISKEHLIQILIDKTSINSIKLSETRTSKMMTKINSKKNLCFILVAMFVSFILSYQQFIQGRKYTDLIIGFDNEKQQLFHSTIPHESVPKDVLCGPSSNETSTTTTSKTLPPPDTSIIILSNLIPTHPSIDIINQTYNSLFEMLVGLPLNTPIYISVDGLPTDKQTPENIERLHDYVKNLRWRFLKNNPHDVTILNNYQHGHISNSIRAALELISTPFVYVIQHDLYFVKPVNHTGLIHAMQKYPEKLQIVRFGKDKQRKHQVKRFDYCRDRMGYSITISKKLYFSPAGVWSDNNHLTTKAYYTFLLKTLGPAGRSPEFAMQRLAEQEYHNVSQCYYRFQFLYNWVNGPFLGHSDGRQTEKITQLQETNTTIKQ